MLEALDKVAAKHKTQQATVALAWLLAQPGIGAPIVSATSKEQIESFAKAPDLKLDAGDLSLLDRASK